MQIDHVNGNKTNNNVLNFRECTREENIDACAISSGFTSYCYSKTGEVVLANAPNKLRFNSERSLEKKIGLRTNSLTKLPMNHPVPESWIRATIKCRPAASTWETRHTESAANEYDRAPPKKNSVANKNCN
jgi:hypothetical protein